MENTAVVLRVRPILTNERKYGDASCIEVVDGAKRKVQVKVHPSKIDYFKCCRCFARDTQQAQLFSECGLTNLIDVAMKGNAISIFSYGETGSGKTFTLFGTPKVFGTKEKKSGLILRTLRYLFTKLRENDIKVQVQLSSVEILNEQVFDLFVSESDRSPLVVHEDENAIITLSKLTLCNCFDYSSASETLEKIVLNRCSPRQRDSHCLTEIHISIPSTTESGNVSCVPLSKISFVDLMGSELFHANQQREGNDLVDNSLYVVSKVIDGIEHEDNNNTRVTDSVLTTLLSRSIGVRGRSLLVACVCEAKLNVEETIRTLKFSCKPAPKLPKYLDPQAKLVYDLKRELHVLSHRNRQLRSTQIKAPTWELHALSHSSPKAMKKESSDEKALIAMHNEIFKANETYTFKPRTGGRMYFPSPVAGREIPIKPTKKYQYEKELLKSGGYLENSSLVSSMDGDFRAFSSAAGGGGGLGGLGESSLLTGTNTRPSTTTSHVRKEVSIHTLEDVLRRQCTPGPIVFKTKRTSVSPSSRDRPSSSSRVVEVPPLRATTRLGFGREGRDWEQVDWPTVIRKRVADKLSTIAMGELEKEPEPKFTWKKEDPVESPFVAHLVTKPLPEPERPRFEIRHWQCSTFSDPPKDSRPVTAPSTSTTTTSSSRRPHSRQIPRTGSTESADGLDGTTPEISRPSTGRSPRSRRRPIARVQGDSSKSNTSNLIHGSNSMDSFESTFSAQQDELQPEVAMDSNSPDFNPLRPSVFAASLMSDPNLARRQSTVESLAAFASSMSRIQVPDSLDNHDKMEPLQEETPDKGRESNSGKNSGGKIVAKSVPKLRNTNMMYRQNSERSRLSAENDPGSCGGVSKMSSKSSSFSSLPAVDGITRPPGLKQKSNSIRVNIDKQY